MVVKGKNLNKPSRKKFLFLIAHEDFDVLEMFARQRFMSTTAYLTMLVRQDREKQKGYGNV